MTAFHKIFDDFENWNKSAKIWTVTQKQPANATLVRQPNPSGYHMEGQGVPDETEDYVKACLIHLHDGWIPEDGKIEFEGDFLIEHAAPTSLADLGSVQNAEIRFAADGAGGFKFYRTKLGGLPNLCQTPPGLWAPNTPFHVAFEILASHDPAVGYATISIDGGDPTTEYGQTMHPNPEHVDYDRIACGLTVCDNPAGQLVAWDNIRAERTA